LRCLGIVRMVINALAEKHGRIVKGVCALPVRDELRLRKLVC